MKANNTSEIDKNTSKSKYTAKLLLVDDHPANLVALSAVLDSSEYECVLANSGREALSILLKEQDFAIILLDVQMPEMDGFETASMINQYEKTCNIPIVFITAAYTSLDDMIKGYDLNAVDYILKPFNPEILKKKVGVLVELYRRTQQTIEELQELKKMSGSSTLATSKSVQYISLQKSSNDEFITLTKDYEQILEQAVEEQIYRRKNQHSKLLKHFISKLCSMLATPKDIIDIHLLAVEKVQIRKVNMPKNAYLEEGRMLLLETMGELASFYRQIQLPPLEFNSDMKEVPDVPPS